MTVMSVEVDTPTSSRGAGPSGAAGLRQARARVVRTSRAARIAGDHIDFRIAAGWSTVSPVDRAHHTETPGSRLRALRGLREQRGLSTTEYVIILICIAVIGISAWRSFGSSARDRTARASGEVAGLEATPGQGGGARGGGGIRVARSSSSALDEATEKKVYEQLLSLVRAGDGALFSIAHRPGVASFHGTRWVLQPQAAGTAARYKLVEQAA